MANKGIVWVIIGLIIVIIVIGVVLYGRAGKNDNYNTKNTGGVKENVIEITSNGFNPNVLEINQGERVTFVNEDSSEHWPASAMHPTHRVYPGSDIAKCGTAEENKIFDACKGLGLGKSYSFTFNEKGRWNYHDHLNPTKFGVIVVN